MPNGKFDSDLKTITISSDNGDTWKFPNDGEDDITIVSVVWKKIGGIVDEEDEEDPARIGEGQDITEIFIPLFTEYARIGDGYMIEKYEEVPYFAELT